MKYKKIIRYNETKRGFTLVELLAIIIILSLILSIALGIINVVMIDVDDKIDETTKNIILSTANEYAIEFRGTDGWKEEKNADGEILFCISFDSLVEQGYFENNGSNYEDISSGYYAIKGKIVDGVYNYEFIEGIDYLADDDICKYYRRGSNFYVEPSISDDEKIDVIENSSVIVDEITGEELGDFDYTIKPLKDNKYSINFGLDVNLYDIINNNSVYVNLVIDESSSMDKNNKFTKAMNAALNFSTILSQNEDINAKMSLIEFGLQPVLKRNFATPALTIDDFSTKANGGGTNASGGIDLATSLIVNETLSENSDIYTILLFDGAPYDYSYIKYTNANKNRNNVKIYPKKIYDETKIYDIVDDAEIYYKNFYNAIDGCGDKKNCDAYTIDIEDGTTETIKAYVYEYDTNSSNLTKAWNHLAASSNYLKNLGSKLIVIGYGTDFKTKAQNIASKDSKLCSGSEDGESCYYYNSTGDDISALFTNLANNILKYSSANRIKLSLTPISKDGHQLVNIFDSDNGNSLDKIEIELDLENLELVDGNLKLSDNYQFKISNYMYESMNCENEICEYDNHGVQLFEINLELLYPDGKSKNVEIEQPLFNVGLYKENTLN